MKHILKTLAASTALATALLAAPSFAATNSWYAGASGDLTWMGDSDMGGGANVDIGYRFDQVRVEGEVGYHDADGGGDSNHYWAYMGNAYYDFNNNWSMSGYKISPYVGAGLGDAEIDGNSTFAWQGMAGVNFASASAPNTTYRLGYRYFGADDRDPHASNIELGMNVGF